MRRSLLILSILTVLSAGCATQKGVDRHELSRLVGKDNDVRVDAQVFADRVGPGSQVWLTYEVQNLRPDPIAVADMVPTTEYDQDTHLITIQLGSEVPGNELLPRLIEIRSGETKTFQAVARIDVTAAKAGFPNTWPQQLRVRLSFLQEIGPFGELIGIDEKAVHDPKLADELFMPWVNAHRFVTTNSIPVNWGGVVAPTAPNSPRGVIRH